MDIDRLPDITNILSSERKYNSLAAIAGKGFVVIATNVGENNEYTSKFYKIFDLILCLPVMPDDPDETSSTLIDVSIALNDYEERNLVLIDSLAIYLQALLITTPYQSSPYPIILAGINPFEHGSLYRYGVNYRIRNCNIVTAGDNHDLCKTTLCEKIHEMSKEVVHTNQKIAEEILVKTLKSVNKCNDDQILLTVLTIEGVEYKTVSSEQKVNKIMVEATETSGKMDSEINETSGKMEAEITETSGKMEAESTETSGKMKAEMTETSGKLEAESTETSGKMEAEMLETSGKFEAKI